MRVIIYKLLIWLSCSVLCANEPISLIIKIRGSVKKKSLIESNKHSKIKINYPIIDGDGLVTKNKSFAKVAFLDDESIISIFPNTELYINGKKNNQVINKHISLIQGVLKVSVPRQKYSKFKLTTKFSEIECIDECVFWIFSNECGAVRTLRSTWLVDTGKQ